MKEDQSQARKRQTCYGNQEMFKEKEHTINQDNSGYQNNIIILIFLAIKILVLTYQKIGMQIKISIHQKKINKC